MGWVDDLKGRLVGIDTAPLIYYIEGHPTYLPIVEPFFDALVRRDLRGVTSTITLVEVLTHPLRTGRDDIAHRYRALLRRTRGLTLAPVSAAIAEEAARLRASHSLHTPDAVQLATAKVAGIAAFLTNDKRLAKVADLEVLVVDLLPQEAADTD